jgi:HD-like signal output (HDOD) protein
MTDTKTILIVDDEKNIISALRRLFASEDIRVLTAVGAMEALDILGQNPNTDLVISDYKMPFMNGIEFLTEVKRRFPQVFRVILSGYVETDSITSAIGQGIAMAYFKKPWSEYNLVEKVMHILDTLDSLRHDNLIEIFNKIQKLPSIPDIYYKLETAISAGSSVDMICSVIKKDASLTAKILQIGNSVFYGGKDYATLEQVVKMIGLSAIRDIALIYKMTENITYKDIDKKELSDIVRCGIMLNKGIEHYYLKKDNRLRSSVMSTAGLLSCIGRIILLAYFPERYQITMEMMRQRGASFADTEANLGHINDSSCALAGYFLDLYNMPFELVDIVLNSCRHITLKCEQREATELLYRLSAEIDKIIFCGIKPDATNLSVNSCIKPEAYESALAGICDMIENRRTT